MYVLVFNCGSSSQNARIYLVEGASEPKTIALLKAKNVDTLTNASPEITWEFYGKKGSQTTPPLTHRTAAKQILAMLKEHEIPIDAIGHRFVHGGRRFTGTTRISPAVCAELQACFPLAPIHNPNSFSVIEVCLEALPQTPQFAVFDTAFHAGLSEAARRYALPQKIIDEYGYFKYGFHGLSLQYVSAKAAALLNIPLDKAKLILCHLGTGGSSVTAFADGCSLDTSMGYSPLTGLVMSTRCGDLDPEIVIDLVRHGHSAEEIETLLNHQSGLVGLSGYSSNLAEVIAKAESGDAVCSLAFEVYANQLRHYLGAYTWRLNGADAIIFTDSIGVSSWQLREKALTGVENLGIHLDLNANRNVDPDNSNWVHAQDSKVGLLVLPTDEERVILDEVVKAV